MNIAALLTSAGINIAICILLFSLYSILRKQPGNRCVYFGRRLTQLDPKRYENICIERFVPSPSWIVKAWTTTEEELLAVGGLDSVVFVRIVIFSIRIFSIAAVICMFLVLPLNYYGKEMQHKKISSESLEVFTIVNVNEGSKWFWAHCLALYVISCSACVLLYFEYKSITKMRLAHITESPPNPSHFTILVRSIPWSVHDSYSDSVRYFFTKYHAARYLSHQMVHRNGTVQKIMNDAEKMYNYFKDTTTDPSCKPTFVRCGLCGYTTNSFKILSSELESDQGETHSADWHFDANDKKWAATAFVFFKSRYDAVIASYVLQSSNPMLWATDLAPEPNDVYWSNLCIPYKQLWIRKIATLLASIVFMFLFLIPVTFVQGLTQLDQLKQKLPFLKGMLKTKFISQLATGYLPSVILMLSLYIVPPMMMLFSAVEGSISRSGRKKSAACKVLYFTIWNVFFVNVLSGSVISQLNVISSLKDIPSVLARAVPIQASFFTTYVLTSGWASLATEVMQIFGLISNLYCRYVIRKKEPSTISTTLSFPYHTEVPKVLLFGLLGFTCSVLSPLILPFLLIYFFLAYLVYRNQILNVYINKYESGGQFWPVVHNTTIFSLVLTQVIALGVFGLKRSPVAAGFIFPLVIFTLLFNEYCRQRFFPIFKNHSAEVLIDLDRQDEQSGRMEDIHQQLHTAYCQLTVTSPQLCKANHAITDDDGENTSVQEDIKLDTVTVKLDTVDVQTESELTAGNVSWTVRCNDEESTEKCPA